MKTFTVVSGQAFEVQAEKAADALSMVHTMFNTEDDPMFGGDIVEAGVLTVVVGGN